MFSAFTRTAVRAARASSRRNYSSAPHAPEKASSDLPWIIGSAAVFIPTIFYMTAPPAKSAHGHAEHHAAPAAVEEEEVEEVAEVQDAAPAAVEEPAMTDSAPLEAAAEAALADEPKEESPAAPVGKLEKKEAEIKAAKEIGEERPAVENKGEGSAEAKLAAKSGQPEGHNDSAKNKANKAGEHA